MAEEGMNAQGVAITLLVAGEIPNFFSGFLPSLFTISTFSGGDPAKIEHTKKWIRRGEMQATGLALLFGLGGTMISGKPWALLAAGGMSGYLLWQYECALRKGCTSGMGYDMDKPEQAEDRSRNRWYPKASPAYGR